MQADQNYYQGRLFEGIAYTLTGDEVSAIEIYSEGRCKGSSQDPYFDVPEDTARIQYDRLTPWHEDYEEPFSYNGQPFNGMAYRFEGDYCVGQYLIEEGEASKTLGWLKGTNLVYYEYFREQFQEHATCYPSGGLKHLELSMKGNFSLDLKLNEDQAVSSFTLTGNYFEKASLVAGEFFFFPVTSEEILSSWRIAPYLFLSGDAINDTIFQSLQDQNGFRELQKLSLYQTAVTGAEIQKLAQIPQLIEVRVNKQDAIKDALKNLKIQRPDMTVRYQGESLN